MTHEARSKARRALAGAMLFTASACATTAPAPRPVSDFCLNDRRVTVSVAPAAGQDDPGNRFDTDATVSEAFAHNAVLDRLCPGEETKGD